MISLGSAKHGHKGRSFGASLYFLVVLGTELVAHCSKDSSIGWFMELPPIKEGYRRPSEPYSMPSKVSTSPAVVLLYRIAVISCTQTCSRFACAEVMVAALCLINLLELAFCMSICKSAMLLL